MFGAEYEPDVGWRLYRRYALAHSFLFVMAYLVVLISVQQVWQWRKPPLLRCSLREAESLMLLIVSPGVEGKLSYMRIEM
jgi:hypothetical protein